MSGTPKYCNAELDRKRREQLEQERRRQAEQEARRRHLAEERERMRRLDELRAKLAMEGAAILQSIKSQRHEIYSNDATALEGRCEAVVRDIRAADAEKEIRAQEREIQLVARDFSDAAARKRRDDAEKKRLAELDHQRFRLEEVERRFLEIRPTEATKFDLSGANAVRGAISEGHAALAVADAERAKRGATRAEGALERHVELVNRRREDWYRQRNDAAHCIVDLRSHMEGLKADPMLARWHGASVSDLSSVVRNAEDALAEEQFGRPAEILADVQARSVRLLEEANEAQLKADQRDYIVKSIAETLLSMGFTVSPPRAEHQNHPSSAIVIDAARGSNKAISVNVPVKGRIEYTVDGFSTTTDGAVGGGTATACDEAERVLTEMQESVEAAFGVKMDEIWWDDKDPNRKPHKADDLPSGGQRQQGRGRR